MTVKKEEAVKTTEAAVAVKTVAKAEPVKAAKPVAKKVNSGTAIAIAEPEVNEEQQEQIKINIEQIKKLELDELLKVELKQYSFGKKDVEVDPNATSSVIINGDRLTPVITGVELRQSGFTSHMIGNTYLPPLNIEEHDTATLFDVYVFKYVYQNVRAFALGSAGPEVKALRHRLDSKERYQILLVDAKSKVNLDTADAMFGYVDTLRDAPKVSTGLVIDSTVNNSLFIGMGAVSKSNVNKVIIKDSLIGTENKTDGLYWTSKQRSSDVQNCIVKKSVVLSSKLGGEKKFFGDNIEMSRLTNVTLTFGYMIKDSELKNVNCKGSHSSFNKSNLTNLRFDTTGNVHVKNTTSHHERQLNVRASDGLRINSVFDLNIFNVGSGLDLIMVRGIKGFVLNADFGNSREHVIPHKQDTKVPHFSPYYSGYMPNGLLTTEPTLDEYLETVLHPIFGKSEFVDNMRSHLAMTIRGRINISNTINSVKRLTDITDRWDADEY